MPKFPSSLLQYLAVIVVLIAIVTSVVSGVTLLFHPDQGDTPAKLFELFGRVIVPVIPLVGVPFAILQYWLQSQSALRNKKQSLDLPIERAKSSADFAANLENFHQAVVQRDWERASRIEQDLAKRTENTSEQELTIERVQGILAIANGQYTLENIERLGLIRQQPDHVACAQLRLYELKKVAEAELVRFLEMLPQNTIRDLTIKDLWIQMHQDLMPNECLPEWPLRLDFDPRLFVKMPEPLNETFPFNLFPDEKANAEGKKSLLFSNKYALFFDKHSLFRELNQDQGLYLISGDRGAGRTALALALGEYMHPRRMIAICLADKPDLNMVETKFTEKLIAFIRKNPECLGKYRENAPASYKLLARFLVRAVGVEHVVLNLGQTSDPLIQELVEQVNVTSVPPYQDHAEWVRVFKGHSNGLGLTHIRLVIDCGDPDPEKWLVTQVIDQLTLWKVEKVGIRIFVPIEQGKEGIQQVISFPVQHGFSTARPEWESEKSSLYNLVKWRHEQIADLHKRYQELEELIPRNVLDKALETANWNPQSFVTIWEEMINGATSPRLTMADLERAID